MTPTWVLFEVTRDCNRSCVYCYNPDRQKPRDEHLSPPHLRSLVDRLFADGPLRGVTIIGGEPLVVDQLDDVVRSFARRVRTVVSTNGLLLDRDRISRLVDAGVGGFEVSLDSPNPSTHAALTRAVGLERVREGLAELALTGVPVTVGAVLTRATVPGLGELMDLCFALSVSRLVLAQLAPVGQARHCAPMLALSDREFEDALAVANARSAELDLPVGIGLPVEPCRIDRGRYPNLEFEACRCGAEKWVLEPGGDVRTCELAETSIGNLFEASFADLVTSEAVGKFRNTHSRSECATCLDWEVCQGGCRFRSTAAGPHGDARTTDR